MLHKEWWGEAKVVQDSSRSLSVGSVEKDEDLHGLAPPCPSCHRAECLGGSGSTTCVNGEEQKWVMLGTRLSARKKGVKYLPSAFCNRCRFFHFILHLQSTCITNSLDMA